MRKVGLDEVKERIKHYAHIAMAGADDVEAVDLGLPVVLWRRFRDGTETREVLSLWLAELTLAAIPRNEPAVVRASIKR